MVMHSACPEMIKQRVAHPFGHELVVERRRLRGNPRRIFWLPDGTQRAGEIAESGDEHDLRARLPVLHGFPLQIDGLSGDRQGILRPPGVAQRDSEKVVVVRSR